MREINPQKVKSLPFMLLMGAAMLAPVAFAAKQPVSAPKPAATPSGKFVVAYTDGQDPQSYANLQLFHSNLSAVALGSSWGLKSNGKLDTSGLTTTTSNIIAYAKQIGLPVYATVSDWSDTRNGFDPNVSKTIDKNATNRNNAVTTLVNLAVSNGFAGIDLDIEAVGNSAPTASDTRNFSAFVAALATGLHAKGLKLIESVPPSDGTDKFSFNAGYDYAALGAAVDYFQVMTYDEVGPGYSSSPSETWPGPVSGLDWMDRIISYAITKMSSSKILLGLPTYGQNYSLAASENLDTQVTWAADDSKNSPGFGAFIAAKGAIPAFDTASSTPHADWGKVTQQTGDSTPSTVQPTLWYDTPASITAKAGLVGKYNLAGTGVWAMGYEDATFWDAHNAGL